MSPRNAPLSCTVLGMVFGEEQMCQSLHIVLGPVAMRQKESPFSPMVDMASLCVELHKSRTFEGNSLCSYYGPKHDRRSDTDAFFRQEANLTECQSGREMVG